MALTYLSLSSTDCPSSALTVDVFVGPSTEAESGSVTVVDITFAGFDTPLAVELFTFVVAGPALVTGAHDVLTVFVAIGAGPLELVNSFTLQISVISVPRQDAFDL